MWLLEKVLNGVVHPSSRPVPLPGVRFNAEKKQVGKYFSTKIWSFTMKAPCCKEARALPWRASPHFLSAPQAAAAPPPLATPAQPLARRLLPAAQVIEVHTDPKAAQYVLVRGARQKVEEFTAEAVETAELKSRDEVEAARANPFSRLETGLADVQRARAAAPTVAELQRMQTERSRDDYTLNKQLRRGLREQRHAAQALSREHGALNMPAHIPLLPAAAQDAAAAAAVRFGAPGGAFERSQELLRSQRTAILSAPLLGRGGEAAGPSGRAGAALPAAARKLDEAEERRAELMVRATEDARLLPRPRSTSRARSMAPQQR